jgi:hypothetical protein
MHGTIRGLAVACAIATFLLPAAAASAHGDEEVGDLEVVIGFGTEPAYAGMPNSVQVILSHGGEPVTDAEGLTAEVSFGDASTTLDLEPNFAVGVYGEPGDYRGWFVPSQPGPYTFHIMGEVDDEELDIEMTSGPDAFAEVQDTLESAFPPVDAPSNDELAGRLDAEGARVEAAQAAAQQAADDADQLRTIAILGLVMGTIGLLAAIAALARSRRTA